MDPTTDTDVEDPDAVLDLFSLVAGRAAEILRANDDWSWSGRRATQYSIDVEIDDACRRMLHDAGLAVLSEETEITLPDDRSIDAPPDVVAVVDPLDGSTNAALGLPWCATAICLVVDGVKRVALVRNLRTGDEYSAVLGRGALQNGQPITVGEPTDLDGSIVAVNGRPTDSFTPRQFRCLGSTALDLAVVASGRFAGYIDFDDDKIGVWDYLASTLIVEEAGGVCADAGGRPLVTLDPSARRRPVVASSPALLEQLLAVS